MTQSSSTTVGSMFRSMIRARAVACAPVFSALLALPSLAHAQEPSVPAAASESTAAPAEQATPVEQTVPAAPATPAPHATPATTVAPSHDTPNTTLEPSRPRVHQGFYLRLTTGPTLLTLNGHGPYGSASLTGGGAGGMIAIGGAVAPGFVLAGMIGGSGFKAEFNGGPFEDGTVTARGKTYPASDRASGGFGMVGMMFDWYPDPSDGWHFGAAPGLGVTVLTNQADHRDFGGVNFAGSVFGGYDWALGRKWALGLQLVASGGTQTKLVEEEHSHENDVRDTGYRLTPFSVGVQASLLYF